MDELVEVRFNPSSPRRINAGDSLFERAYKSMYWIYDDEDGKEVWTWECQSCFLEGKSGPPHRVLNAASKHIETHFLD